jgi:hypothetical protein
MLSLVFRRVKRGATRAFVADLQGCDVTIA